MPKSLKIVVPLILVVGIGILAIMYFSTDLFKTPPKDDRIMINQTKNVDGKSTKVIGIANDNADLKLHKSNNDQVQVRLNGKIPKQDAVNVNVTKQGNELYVDVKYEENVSMKGHSKEKDDEVQVFPTKLTLDVSLPSKIYDSINLKSDGGDLTGDLPLQASDIEVDTKTGSMNLSKLTGEHVQFSSDEGNVQIKNLKASHISLFSLYGSISLQDAEGKLNGKTNSGDLNISRCNCWMIVNSNSGDINVDQVTPLFASNEFTTDYGNVTFQFRSTPTDLYMALTSESGSMKNNLPIKKITDKDDDYYGKRYIKGTIGRGLGANLLIGTQKGNINVILKK